MPRSDGETLDPVDARKLLNAADSNEIGPLVAVLLLTGLRKGEALGLGWSSIDLESSPATLTVTRALKRGESDVLYLDGPETIGSRRTIHRPRLPSACSAGIENTRHNSDLSSAQVGATAGLATSSSRRRLAHRSGRIDAIDS